MYLCFLTCIPFTQTCVLLGATLINQNPEKRRLLNYKALGFRGRSGGSTRENLGEVGR